MGVTVKERTGDALRKKIKQKPCFFHFGLWPFVKVHRLLLLIFQSTQDEQQGKEGS